MGRKNKLKNLSREEFLLLLNANIGDLEKLWRKLKVSKVTGHNYMNHFGIKVEKRYV